MSINAVSFRFDPPYTYTSGLLSPIYLDNRLIMSYPDVRKKIMDLYIVVIKEQIGLENVEWISATATTAIPHGSWIADKLNLPLVFVRPTTKMAGQGKKSYGKGNKMEGFLKKGARVLIIEDHISTATSALDNVQTIRDEGGLINFCIATTSYETNISINAMAAAKVKLLTLTTGKLIAKRAFEKGNLTHAEQKSVLKWLADPEGWRVW